MAARRLILVMLVLLVVSSIAAALVPVERNEDEPSTSTTATESARPQGELVRVTVAADERKAEPIRISLGDQLELRVTAKRAAQVEIPAPRACGRRRARIARPLRPLAADPGDYPISLLELGTEAPARTIGKIEVAPAEKRAQKPA